MNTVVPIRPVTVADCIAEYREHIRRRRSAKTLQRYESDLAILEQWAGTERPAALTARDLENGFLYGEWSKQFEVRNGREASRQSLRAAHTALSGLYRYLVNQGLLTDENGRPVANPMMAIDPPKISRRRNDWLRTDDDNELLDETPMDVQEAILVHFPRRTGLRIGEILALRVEDVDLTSRTVYVNDSKTDSGIREVPIAESLVRRIKEWNAYVETKIGRPRKGRDRFLCTTRVGRWKDASGQVLTSDPGQPMKPQQVERIVRRVGERAGIQRLTPHRLRRTYASQLLNAGMRLESVSVLLGHADSRVTQQSYASLTPATVRREFEAVAG